MSNPLLQTEHIVYPSIVFRIKGGLYCVNSRYITTLLRLPNHEPLPDAPPFVTGIFPYRGDIITMLDLRLALGKPSLAEEYQAFADMLETRKQDHIRWVDELERSSHAGEPFTLATDPHQCAFGKWYDHYTCDNNAVMFHLRKIDEPHQKLHRASHEVLQCSQDCDHCTREKCLKTIFEEVRTDSMARILGLLDEAKEIFRETVFREMVMVMSEDSHIGIVVDEILAVEHLTPAGRQDALHSLPASPYLSRMMKSEKMDELILEIDAEKIQNAISRTA